MTCLMIALFRIQIHFSITCHRFYNRLYKERIHCGNHFLKIFCPEQFVSTLMSYMDPKSQENCLLTLDLKIKTLMARKFELNKPSSSSNALNFHMYFIHKFYVGKNMVYIV